MEQNQDIFDKIMEKGDFSNLVTKTIMAEVYRRLNISEQLTA